MLPRRLEGLPCSRLADDAVVHEARTFASRLLGLALLRELPFGHALLIPDCRSVHTFGMRYALDLYWLDAAGDLVRVDRAVPPRRLRTCARADSVLEVPSA